MKSLAGGEYPWPAKFLGMDENRAKPAEPPQKSRNYGQWLVRIVVLVGLFSLLATVVAPHFLRTGHRAPRTMCKSNLKNIGTAFEMYSTDWGGLYPPRLEQLTPNYLKTIPTCPSAERVTYVYTVGLYAGYNDKGYKDYYYVSCFGENHKMVSVHGNFPAYDGLRGLYERAP